MNRTTLLLALLLCCGLQQSLTAGTLGVRLKDCGGNGALVVHVDRGSSAQKMRCSRCNQEHRLVAGVNVITAVNGVRVRNVKQAVASLSNSPTDARVTVLNLRRRTEQTYRTRLAPTRKSTRRQQPAWSEADDGGDDFYEAINFDSGNFDDSDSFSQGIWMPGNHFHWQIERNTFNRNYPWNPDHGR